MDISLKAVLCCLVLLSAGPKKNKADDFANDLINALTNFVEANSEEINEEIEKDLEQVQLQLELQNEKTEELESEIQQVAEHAMVGPRCAGVTVRQFCYVLHNQKLNYEMANVTCLKKESRLADIRSRHEYHQVMEYIAQHDAITDRSVIFAWTRMRPDDFPALDTGATDEHEHFVRWIPGYPRESGSFDRVAWQIVSSDLFADHGYFNIPGAASAYPLCQHKLERVCQHNQVYQECGTACPLVCGEEPVEVCHEECVEGCGCPTELPYLTETGHCVIDVEECPTEPTTTVKPEEEEEEEEMSTTTEPTTPSETTSTRQTTTRRTRTTRRTTTRRTTTDPPITEQTTTTTEESGGYSAQAMAMLRSHNVYRIKHQAPPMTMSESVTRDAQAWADDIAARDVFEHAPWADRNGQGENLARWWSETETLGHDVTTAWYNEVDDYDYNNPVFGMNTGHFTQVVWKGSVELGVGIATSASGRVYIVARYSPSGNWAGQFGNNVLPPLDE